MKYLIIFFSFVLASCEANQQAETQKNTIVYDTIILNENGHLLHKIPNGVGGFDYIGEVNLWNAIEKDKGIAATVSTIKTKVVVHKSINTGSQTYFYITTDEGKSGWLLSDWVEINVK
jgi:hypothetical protein